MKTNITTFSLNRNNDPEFQKEPIMAELLQRFHGQSEQLMTFALDPRDDGQQREMPFKQFEQVLISMIFAFARTLVMIMLTAAEQRINEGLPNTIRRAGRRFRKVEAKRAEPAMLVRGGTVLANLYGRNRR